MNKLIFSAVVLLSAISHAGVGGGGGGVLPSMLTFAGVGGGGGGVRPDLQRLPAPFDPSQEMVKTLQVGDDSMTLLYKALGSTKSQVLRVRADDIDPAYTAILLDSWEANEWVEIK